ncbi:tetratricopeptide repeat protein [Streptomyces sp. NPDC016626]|uniref:tetratricopeptide repeat protein n=1 Tax=Streptomyces sp. NPDC016626 TaxID=3364968 RepID=UPI0036F84926
MSRLSRENKREQQQAAHAANRAAAPIDVRVPVGGEGAGGASVGGVPVIPGPGEEIQQVVLDRLHRLAIASGHAVLATVHDERIGYVVPLRVEPDGSSHFTAQPVLTGPAQDRRQPSPDQALEPGRDRALDRDRDQAREAGGQQLREPARDEAREPARDGGPVRAPGPDRPTHLLRSVPEPQTPPAPVTEPAPVRDSTPTFTLRPLPGAQAPRDSVPTARLRAVPGSAEAAPPGTVAPPTGAFGPPPPMDARPHPAPELSRPSSRAAEPPREPDPEPEPELAFGPDPRPTPPRGFDAVAEAVLGDDPPGASGDHLAEPMARVNDAVRAGRIDTAARLAGETMAEASVTLGPEHPEVLRLRELTAYIAYLAGEPLRAFRISLDLAVICRRAEDAEAAYGNVRSAATAWRAVRDPQLGLRLGHELIALWTELTAEDGPAADEIEELECARVRMGRLTERAGSPGA